MKKFLSLFLILTFLVALPITSLNALAKTSEFERPVYGDAFHQIVGTYEINGYI